jgi:hypothetical protein
MRRAGRVAGRYAERREQSDDDELSSNCRNELVRTTTASDLPMKLKPSHFQDVSMKL